MDAGYKLHCSRLIVISGVFRTSSPFRLLTRTVLPSTAISTPAGTLIGFFHHIQLPHYHTAEDFAAHTPPRRACVTHDALRRRQMAMY